MATKQVKIQRAQWENLVSLSSMLDNIPPPELCRMALTIGIKQLGRRVTSVTHSTTQNRVTSVTQRSPIPPSKTEMEFPPKQNREEEQEINSTIPNTLTDTPGYQRNPPRVTSVTQSNPEPVGTKLARAGGNRIEIRTKTKTKNAARASRTDPKSVYDYALEIDHWRSTPGWNPESKPFQAVVEFVVAYRLEFKDTPTISKKRDFEVFRRILLEFGTRRILLTNAFQVYFAMKWYRDRGCPASGMGDARALAEIVKKAKRIEVPDETEPVRPRQGGLQVGLNNLLAVDAWAEILAAAKEQVDSGAFKTWFAPAIGSGFDNTTLVVRTENGAQKQFLVANYSDEILEWANKVREGMDVAFEVGEEATE